MPVTINGTTGITSPGETVTGNLSVNQSTGGFLTTDGAAQTNFQMNTTTSGAMNWRLTNEGNAGRLRFLGNNGTNTVFPMFLNTGGQVTMPSQPAFSAYSTQNFFGTGQTPIQFSVADFNIGSNYNTSTYRFTAPIAGRYLFTTSIAFYLNGNARQIAISLRKNGSTYVVADAFIAGVQSNNTHTETNIDIVMELAASDYVDVSWDFATASVNFYSDNKRCNFAGYLLG